MISDPARARAWTEIEQQYETFPFPWAPGAEAPPLTKYLHQIVSARWRIWRRDWSGEHLTILDAGCGSGRNALILAEMNPEADVVGIDLSGASLKLAEEACRTRAFHRASFKRLRMEDVAELGMKFDYINADEVLYLVPDPLLALQSLASVLKPLGILRATFHCAFQRLPWLRAQKFFRSLNLMRGADCRREVEVATEVMNALSPTVPLVRQVWRGARVKEPRHMMVNTLLRGDRGFEFPEIFALLKSSGLEFASMAHWNLWSLQNLFREEVELPTPIMDRLESMTLEEELTVVQLLRGDSRLLDFWAVRSTDASLIRAQGSVSFAANAVVAIHPLANQVDLKSKLASCIRSHRALTLSQFWPVPLTHLLVIDPLLAAVLLPLCERDMKLRDVEHRFESLRSPQAALCDVPAVESTQETTHGVLHALVDAGLILVCNGEQNHSCK